MSRVMITDWTTDPVSGRPKQRIVGWFEAAKAERLPGQRSILDGTVPIGVHLHDKQRGEALWRTARGRWILEQWSTCPGEENTYRYLGDAAAREWLLIDDSAEAERWLRRHFPPVEEERGPGRPEIGPRIVIRLPKETIAHIDEEAQRVRVSRAEMIRKLLETQLPADEDEATPEH